MKPSEATTTMDTVPIRNQTIPSQHPSLSPIHTRTHTTPHPPLNTQASTTPLPQHTTTPTPPLPHPTKWASKTTSLRRTTPVPQPQADSWPNRT